MKKRLDQLLLDRQLVNSRTRAQSLIMRGDVLVEDTPILKAGTKIDETANVRVRGDHSIYVSRGGDKLAGAIAEFSINLSDKVVLDVGASTGGFTDCVLQHGATKVYAIDVGHAQLDEKIRQDARVEVYEKTHAKDLPDLDLDPKPNFLVMDVSFISVRKIIDQIFSCMDSPFSFLILVKPQFELEPSYVSKGGVVNDKKKQLEAVSLVSESIERFGGVVQGFLPSVLRGEKKGNQEYFVYGNSGLAGVTTGDS